MFSDLFNRAAPLYPVVLLEPLRRAYFSIATKWVDVRERAIFLMRHGVTEWNRLGIWQGWKGPGLNKAGKEQAEMAGRKLAGIKFSAIYSSDLPRSYETAVIISQVIDAPAPVPASCLRERDLGQLSGRSMKEIADLFPNLRMEREALGANDIYGVESWKDFNERVASCFNGLIENSGKNVLIVTHGGCIMSLVRTLVDPSFDQILDNCGILKLSWDSRRYRYERI